MSKITTIGLDLAKNVFQVHGVDETARWLCARRLRRSQVLGFFGGMPRCLVGMEACATAHYWARELRALGHEVRLMPPQYVKAYVKRNKNDAADAEAICEAVSRPSMRFVPVKTVEQQSALLMHRGAGSAGSTAHHAGQCIARSLGRIWPYRGTGTAQGVGADCDCQGRQG